jgi:isopropylmalate/homocitrate/citramalate synthase
MSEPSNVLTDLFRIPIEQPILITDNSLRDGEQAPELAYSLDEKLAIATALAELGVHGINVGFPAVSAEEQRAVREIVALKLKVPRIIAFTRLVQADMDCALECGVHWITTFIPTSDSHLRDKLRMTEAQALAQMEKLLPYARAAGLRVQFAFEDATRTPLHRLLRFVEAAQAYGIDTLYIADTVGTLVPSAAYRLFSLLRRVVRCGLACHVHDDLGMATANAIAALEAGADQVDCTLLGLGERAGNTPLEELAVALRVKYGRDLGLRLDLLPRAVEVVRRAAAVSIAANKPIVGEHVFSHESGIHVHGMLSNPVCYESFPPSLVGRKHRIIYGKHSGLRSVAYALEQAALELGEAEQKQLLDRIKREAQDKRKVAEADVIAWAHALGARVIESQVNAQAHS